MRGGGRWPMGPGLCVAVAVPVGPATSAASRRSAAAHAPLTAHCPLAHSQALPNGTANGAQRQSRPMHKRALCLLYLSPNIKAPTQYFGLDLLRFVLANVVWSTKVTI